MDLWPRLKEFALPKKRGPARDKPVARKLIAHDKGGRLSTVEVVMEAAGLAGLRAKKTQRISGRVSPELVKRRPKSKQVFSRIRNLSSSRC